MHRRRDVRPGRRPCPAGDRRSRRQPARLCAGRLPAAGAARGGRRAVPGRRRAGPRLPGAQRADRGAVRRRSLRPVRCADVPHRRPGPAGGGRHARLPRPGRRPDQDPRLPRRTGGDRGGADCRPGRAARRGRGARGPPRLPPAGRLRRRRARCRAGARRAARPGRRCAARLHGAGRGGGAGRAAGHRQRQGRQACAARDALRRRRLLRAARRHRGAAVRAVRRGARPGCGRGARQLLPAGRRLAAGDATVRAGTAGRSRDQPPGPVRPRHRGRAGRGLRRPARRARRTGAGRAAARTDRAGSRGAEGRTPGRRRRMAAYATPAGHEFPRAARARRRRPVHHPAGPGADRGSLPLRAAVRVRRVAGTARQPPGTVRAPGLRAHRTGDRRAGRDAVARVLRRRSGPRAAAGPHRGAAGRGARPSLRRGGRPAAAGAAGPAGRAAPSAGGDGPSPAAGRLVAAAAVRRAVRRLRARRLDGRAAARGAVPYIPGRADRPRPGGGRTGLVQGARRAGRTHPGRAVRRPVRVRRPGHRHPDTGPGGHGPCRCGGPGRRDHREHPVQRRVGHRPRAADRTRRRGVRHVGVRAGERAGGRGACHRAADEHRAVPGGARPGRAAVRRTGPMAERAVRADRPSPPRSAGDPAGDRSRGPVRHHRGLRGRGRPPRGRAAPGSGTGGRAAGRLRARHRALPAAAAGPPRQRAERHAALPHRPVHRGGGGGPAGVGAAGGRDVHGEPGTPRRRPRPAQRPDPPHRPGHLGRDRSRRSAAHHSRDVRGAGRRAPRRTRRPHRERGTGLRRTRRPGQPAGPGAAGPGRGPGADRRRAAAPLRAPGDNHPGGLEERRGAHAGRHRLSGRADRVHALRRPAAPDPGRAGGPGEDPR